MPKKSGTFAKRPASPPAPVLDPVDPKPSRQAAGAILHTAPAIPAGVEAPTKDGWRKYHEINVRLRGDGMYALYNREEACGDRLYKGETGDNVDHPNNWPLETMMWWAYGDLEEAKSAADALQLYLDRHENPKLRSALERYAKEASAFEL